MRFRIKSGWFASEYVVEGNGFSAPIHCLKNGIALEEHHDLEWNDGKTWRLTASYSNAPFVVIRADMIVAEGSLMPESGVEWQLYGLPHSGPILLERNCRSYRRFDRAYGSRGNVIMEARYTCGSINVVVSDAWSDLLPLFIFFCIASPPSQGW